VLLCVVLLYVVLLCVVLLYVVLLYVVLFAWNNNKNNNINKTEQGAGYENLAIYRPFLGALAKLPKAIIIFVISVRLSTVRLPLDGFSWNLMFEYFS
jgi:cytochrome c-type biogenesis protein CcmH/NrfG